MEENPLMGIFQCLHSPVNLIFVNEHQIARPDIIGVILYKVIAAAGQIGRAHV